jgi:hypothetical protein
MASHSFKINNYNKILYNENEISTDELLNLNLVRTDEIKLKIDGVTLDNYYFYIHLNFVTFLHSVDGGTTPTDFNRLFVIFNLNSKRVIIRCYSLGKNPYGNTCTYTNGRLTSTCFVNENRNNHGWQRKFNTNGTVKSTFYIEGEAQEAEEKKY